MKMSAIETAALPPGAMVKHYAVIDSVGFDQQGCVYRAECGLTQRTVCLYEYLPGGLAVRGAGGVHALPGRTEALAKAISSQATRLRAAALLGHPSLPTLEDIWQQNGALYAVGAWHPGRSLLSDLASRPAPIDAELLRQWARVIGDALAALHRHGLIHGNLSPGTIRLLDNGGLLLPPVGGGIFEEHVPAWIAPEQHPLNPRPAPTGPWTDIYQLSALLHQAITGLAPPPVTRRWEGAPLERLLAVSGHFPIELVNAARRGLAMVPAARPATIDEWLVEAGLPDRREHPRFEEADPSEAPPAESPVSASPSAVPVIDAGSEVEQAPDVIALAPAGAATGTGHQPLPVHLQQRFEELERPAARGTPAWVWLAAILAVSGLVGIVIAT